MFYCGESQKKHMVFIIFNLNLAELINGSDYNYYPQINRILILDS